MKPRNLLVVSLTLNVIALVLALVALPKREKLIAERFEIVDVQGVSAGWFASTPTGAELVFRQGLGGASARFVVDERSARFETFGEDGMVLTSVTAALDHASLEVQDDGAKVRLAVDGDGGSLVLSDPSGSVALDSGKDAKSIVLTQTGSELSQGTVTLTVDRVRSLIRVAQGESAAEIGSEKERAWVTTMEPRSRSKVDIRADIDGARIRLEKQDREHAAIEPENPGAVVAPTRSLLIAVGPEKAGVRLDTPDKVVRWPDTESAP